MGSIGKGPLRLWNDDAGQLTGQQRRTKEERSRPTSSWHDWKPDARIAAGLAGDSKPYSRLSFCCAAYVL